jgi:hypothetical protein
VSAAADTYARLTDFGQSRFCPYHGGFITLASCPIVALTEVLLAKQESHGSNGSRADSSTADPLDESVLGGGEDSPRRAGRKTSRRQRASDPITAKDVADGSAASLFVRGNRLQSTLDGKDRLIVHAPPTRPVEQRRRFFGNGPQPLPVPAELAEADGGARLRPARACPQCLHPLPEAIDSHDPLLIPLVGHRAASKTTTMAAFVEQLGMHGPRAFGVDDMAPTEATSTQLTDIMRRYRSRVDVVGNTPDQWHRPLEFLTEADGGGDPSVVFFHDVAGEDVMSPENRMLYAPFVLWADAILFVYNPEASPRLREQSQGLARSGDTPDPTDDVEQAAVLNGLLNDLKASPRLDPTGREHRIPPLVIAVSKADLLPNPPDLSGDLPLGEAVQAALAGLDDGAVVAAGNRWPEVHWHFIAPKPPSGAPQGIVPLFDQLLSLATR